MPELSIYFTLDTHSREINSFQDKENNCNERERTRQFKVHGFVVSGLTTQHTTHNDVHNLLFVGSVDVQWSPPRTTPVVGCPQCWDHLSTGTTSVLGPPQYWDHLSTAWDHHSTGTTSVLGPPQ